MLHCKQQDDLKTTEQRYRKDLENLKSKLEFKERDVEELRCKLLRAEEVASSSVVGQQAKRPRLSVVKSEPKSVVKG